MMYVYSLPKSVFKKLVIVLVTFMHVLFLFYLFFNLVKVMQ